MNYKGSCHCGKVAFEVEGELTQVAECNCSHCSRKGYLMWFVKRSQLRLTTSEDDLATYRFNKHVIDHRFCKTCGCAPFASGSAGAAAEGAAINVRCLEDVDPASLKIVPFDGLSL
jgi:hypothetical protein